MTAVLATWAADGGKGWGGEPLSPPPGEKGHPLFLACPPANAAMKLGEALPEEGARTPSTPSPTESGGEGTPFPSVSSAPFPSAPSGGDAKPPPVCPPATAARVSPESRVITHAGAPRLADLPSEGAQVWTGQGWAHLRVVPPPPGEGEELLRVRCDSGACLVCASTHPWARVVEGEIVPTRACDLRLGDPLVPCPLPPLVGGSPHADAYALGGRGGEKALRPSRLGAARLPACVYSLDAPSFAAYVAGWLDAQGGAVLVGGELAMHDLQVLMARAGFPSVLQARRGELWALAPPPPEAESLPNPRGAPRDFWRPPSPPRVMEIFSPAPRRAAWVSLKVAGAHTLVLDGILTLC